jgi:ankyrin repeat protein
MYLVIYTQMTELEMAPLFMAVAKNEVATVTSLVNSRNVNARISGNCLLHIASTKGHIEIAKLLIAQGADVNATTKTNKTSLFFACREGHTSMVALLLSHGADPSIKTNEGLTPLSIATKKEIVELLSKVKGGQRRKGTRQKGTRRKGTRRKGSRTQRRR